MTDTASILTIPGPHPESRELRFISARDRQRYPFASRTPQDGDWIVTPDIAKVWLEFNTDNFRRLQGKHVDTLAAVMQSGRWRRTHQGIGFLSSGVLADGQHRLAACAKGDVAIILNVATDLDHDSIDIVDTGKKRNASDILRRRGIPSPACAASVARLHLIRTKSSRREKHNPGTEQIAEVATQTPGLAAAVSLGVSLWRRQPTPLFRPTALSFAILIGEPKFGQPFIDFLERASSGLGLVKGSAAELLWRRQVKLTMDRKKRESKEEIQFEVAAIFYAWHFDVRGMKGHVLQVKFGNLQRLPALDYTWRKDGDEEPA